MDGAYTWDSYFHIAISELPKYFEIIFSKMACDFWNIRK